jgi:hypothetical protein
MIVHDFDLICVTISPSKADSPFFIDADRMLPLPIASQSFQLITWRGSKDTEFCCSMQLQQFSQGHAFKGTETLAVAILKQRFSVPGAKALDHIQMITRVALHVKRYTPIS